MPTSDISYQIRPEDLTQEREQASGAAPILDEPRKSPDFGCVVRVVAASSGDRLYIETCPLMADGTPGQDEDGELMWSSVQEAGPEFIRWVNEQFNTAFEANLEKD